MGRAWRIGRSAPKRIGERFQRVGREHREAPVEPGGIGVLGELGRREVGFDTQRDEYERIAAKLLACRCNIAELRFTIRAPHIRMSG